MNETLTISELEERWEKTLAATEKAVGRHPEIYGEIKSLLGDIVTKPLDIGDYPPTAEKLGRLLRAMEDDTQKNIFYFFCDRISPLSISKLKLLRLECLDLLEQLESFDVWRKEAHHLRLLK